MRIIAGKRRGLKIETIETDTTRPTKDMVKEALFSILYSQVLDSDFLDLFAGSGAVGIEALSRGANCAYFNDSNPECIKVIKKNLKKSSFEEEAFVYNLDYKEFLNKIKEFKFDIIFIDPPYNKELGIDSIEIISSYDLLKKNGVLVYETDKIELIPEEIGNFKKFKAKKYGRNVLNFFTRKGN